MGKKFGKKSEQRAKRIAMAHAEGRGKGYGRTWVDPTAMESLRRSFQLASPLHMRTSPLAFPFFLLPRMPSTGKTGPRK